VIAEGDGQHARDRQRSGCGQRQGGDDPVDPSEDERRQLGQAHRLDDLAPGRDHRLRLLTKQHALSDLGGVGEVGDAELQDLDARVPHHLLELGLGPGDVVSYMLGNSPAVFDVLLGAQKIGAIAGPISCWWQANEVQYLVNDSRSKVLVVDPEYVAIADEIADSTPSVEQILINSRSPVEFDRPHAYLPVVIEDQSADRPDVEPPSPGDTASLMYTSGPGLLPALFFSPTVYDV